MNPRPATDARRPPEEGDRRVHAYLAGLPEPELPAALWPRLAATRQRRAARRRHARYGLAAAALLALAVLPLWRAVPPPLAPPPALPAEAIATLAMPSLDDADAIAELRALDRALQSAYEQGASEQEVAALWKARERAAARLQPATAPLPQPLRI